MSLSTRQERQGTAGQSPRPMQARKVCLAWYTWMPASKEASADDELVIITDGALQNREVRSHIPTHFIHMVQVSQKS